MIMADRVVVMSNGRIEQVGRGEDIYRAPATRFVADFIGEANLLPCSVLPDGSVMTSVGSLPIMPTVRLKGDNLVAVLRPEHVIVVANGPTEGLSTVPAIVEDVIHVGSHLIVHARAGDTLISSRVSGQLPVEIVEGANVHVGFRPNDIHLIAD